MATAGEHPVEERLGELFQHLGIARAHVAARVTGDWSGCVATHPESIASLTLVCPTELEPSALQGIAPRLMVLSGDQGRPAEVIHGVMTALPAATLVTLRDYYGHPRADVVAERPEEIGTALLTFLARLEQAHPLSPVSIRAGEGEVAGISYRVRGAGPPLVLLPLGLAPTQWDALLPRLSARYSTITLGGACLGSFVGLEARGQSAGYLGIVRRVMEEVRLQPGEVVLDVGCGTGVLDRWLARYTQGANPIVAVDIHRDLLREAAATARRAGLEGTIEFREGNAEALPFPDQRFDVTFSATVMELLDAEQMLRELLRVTKPGGRIAVVVRAVDMPSVVNVPLPPALKAKAEAIPNGVAGARGCADASLYRRFRQAGLRQVRMLPQLAVYDDAARMHATQERILATFSPEEARAWHAAVAQAETEGTWFIAAPYHCAVGTKDA
jgi:SAM-dependent methyltransferase